MESLRVTGLSAFFFASILPAQSPVVSQSEGTVYVQDKAFQQAGPLLDGSVSDGCGEPGGNPPARRNVACGRQQLGPHPGESEL